MQFGHRASTRWGLALTAAIHAALWCLFVLAARPQAPPQAGKSAVMAVALVAGDPAAAAAGLPGPPQPEAPPLPPPPLPEVPPAPAEREATRYYFPHEVERQLMVRRDHSGDAELDLPHPVSMLLFVDADGKVASIEFEDEIPSPALQRALRDVFMALEFIPATRGNLAVAARLKLRIASNPAALRQR